MSSVKLPPRQKMINMMYLVLTAILALNVSKEVLDSFVRLDADLVRSERSHELRSAMEYDSFERAATEIPEKYKEPFALATAIRANADSLVDHIESIKAMVIAECEGLPVGDVLRRKGDGTDSLMAISAIERKDDHEALTYLLVGSEPASPKQGENSAADLKTRIAAFRDRLKGAIDEKDPRVTAALDNLFDLSDRRDASGTMNNWESMNFYDVPVVAGIATLSKLQADIRSSENDVVKWLHNSVEADIYKVDRLMAAVIPQSDHVMVGDSFRADVFLAAYDSRNTPEILFNGDQHLPVAADGRAQLRLPANGLGDQKGEGMIRFKGPNGTMEFPYAVSYQVVSPTLVASPTKMNVLYRFVENPIDLSVPGIPAERVTAAISNGSIVRGPQGSWIAKPGSGSDARVEAIVTMPEGGTRRVGPAMFRVKDLPPPSPFFAGKTSTDVRASTGEIKAATCVSAKMIGSEFNAPFEIIAFELQIMRGGSIIPYMGNGACFDANMLAALDAVRPNDRVYVQAIKARLKGVPNAPVYALPPIALKVQ